MTNWSSSFLTVSTVDYIPQALATMRSARRHGKHSSFHLFAADATVEAIVDLRRILENKYSWIHVFGPYDLGHERDAYHRVFNYYNLFEVCNVAKYVGISHVLSDPGTEEVCVYADSDTFFLRDVSETLSDMGQNAVLLTPHQFGPSSDDREHDHLLHGWINSGFSAFRRSHTEIFVLLEWLIHRISRRGYLATQYGLSGDQPWLSAFPFLFNDMTFVSPHPGLNVAYWNLDERILTNSCEAILVNGTPLLFFHFSGFERKNSKHLSKHSDLLVPPGSVLEEICRLYRAELDATIALQPKLAGLKTLPCSMASLQERIYVGSKLNGVNISSPTTNIGLFSRIGRKVDSLLRRVTIM